MKKLILALFGILFSINSIFAITYTTKQSAQNLALILDKGRFKGFQIKTTFILNNKNGFYVAVTLSNGKTYRWYMENIYEYYKKNQLELRGNKAIIFDNNDISKFIIFDKNEFHRNALTGEIFKQIYHDGEPLEGLTLFYKIKEFYFLNTKKLSERDKNRDKNGFPYAYRIDLVNGNSYYFSTNEAYRIYLNQQILKQTTQSIHPLGKPYEISSMQAFEKPTDQVGINEFGIELKYDLSSHADSRILIREDQFPIEIYETTFPKKNGFKSKQFIVDILLPNSVFIPKPIFQVNGLEYLESIRLVKSKDRNVSILRGKFNDVNYNFFEIPPTVTKISDDSIFVTFFHNLDQTLPPYADATVKEVISYENKVLISGPKNLQSNTPFGRAYKEAFDFVNNIDQNVLDINESIANYEKSIELFEKAGYLATTDIEFQKALSGRNKTRSRIYIITVKYVEDKIEDPRAQKKSLVKLLDKVDFYTQSPRESNYLSQLKKKLASSS